MSRTILVVDDEQTLRETLVEALEAEGYRVVSAADGREALTRFRADHPDLVLLDLMLPELSGIEVCRIIRAESGVPIVMLTAKDAELDKVVGLELGADDYVTKPFSLRELTARIRALFRRSETQATEAPPALIDLGRVQVDLAGHRLLREGRPVPLKPKAFELLAFLVRHPGRVFTRDQLLEHVWGYDYAGETRTVDVHVHWLRAEIEEDPGNAAAPPHGPRRRLRVPPPVVDAAALAALDRRRPVSFADAPVGALLHEPARRSGEAEMPSHRLLLRAGYLRQLGAGIYSLLPLGFRVTQRVEQVIREEMDRIGCQEIEMPVVHPADLWRESGRYQKIGPELVRFKDRGDRDMVLAMTHEEVIADLLRDVVRSYRQLPVMLYHFQTKFRDEPRSRGGLIRVREFVMKDAYSCDRDEAGLDRSYQLQYGGLRSGSSSGSGSTRSSSAPTSGSWAAAAPTSSWSSTSSARTPSSCATAAATPRTSRSPSSASPSPAAEEPLPMEEIATPGTTTIATLARFLEVGEERTAKAAFFVDRRRPVHRRHRPRRLRRQRDEARQRGQGDRRPATGHGRGDQGPGHGAGLRLADRRRATRLVVVDELVERSPNLVAGANREGFHLRNVNVGRDFTPDLVAEITNAREGDPCPTCGLPVRLRKGIEVGNIFKLGTDFTIPFGATYLGEDGVAHPIVMGSYGIGLGRNVACIVEAHHDEKGIVWPAAVAPYQAHLVAIGANQRPAGEGGRRAPPRGCLHRRRRKRAPELEILYDDRDESPGVKFTDAELLGMPRILTVSPRSLAAGGVEVTDRATGSPLDGPDRGGRGLARRRREAAGRPLRRRFFALRPTMRRCAAQTSRPTTSTPGSSCRADAAPEAIEIAWRALLKRHHPDVAGEASLEAAKRINVAHDWLTDPALRARYDAHADGRRGTSIRAAPTGTVRRSAPPPTATAERDRATRPVRPIFDWDADPRPVDLDLDSPAVVAFLDRRGAPEPRRPRPARPRRSAADRLRREHPAVPLQRTGVERPRRARCRDRCPPASGGQAPDDPRRRDELRPAPPPRRLPRRRAERAVPRTGRGADDPRLGGGRRPSPLRTRDGGGRRARSRGPAG